MKKAFPAAAFILALSFSAVACVMFVDSAAANLYAPTYLPKITINSNGSITPETGYIRRVGNVYTLTVDITEEYSIVIGRNNMVFDGAGHTISVTEGDNSGLRLRSVTNVTVKNVEVLSRYDAIRLGGSDCLFTGVKSGQHIRIYGDFNTITESNVKGYIENGNNNLIIRNNITAMLFVHGSFNNFSQNNILLDDLPEIYGDNFWDDGSVGNYWSDYLMKYPNASEIGNSGIGDTPNVIERGHFSTIENPNASNVDYFPLMYPYDIEKDAIAFPTPEPQPEPEPESFPTALVVGASGVSIAGVAVCVFYYQKKRNH